MLARHFGDEADARELKIVLYSQLHESEFVAAAVNGPPCSSRLSTEPAESVTTTADLLERAAGDRRFR